MSEKFSTIPVEPESWKRVDELFHGALDLPADERAAFLDRSCGEDSHLRVHLDELLAADAIAAERIDSVIDGIFELFALEAPQPDSGGKIVPLVSAEASEVTDAQVFGATQVAERIGPYRILRVLGQGGMGSVYLAQRDDQHYRQEVAIKVLRRGLDHPEGLRRLRQERQILAHLTHPHISRLLDGGNTPEQLPYFVMEYVDGEPIDRFCDGRRETIRARLELFLQACSAVQYAHGNLVIHRDLKPSNILVTGEGVVKLLDFGIAKLLDGELADPLFTPTVPGMRLLTPRYASPEQFLGQPLGIASDVYSLGVLLYELLTGHRPHRAATQRKLEREVCEREPSAPSAVVLGSVEKEGGGLTPQEVSSARGTRPERLRRRLRGDLDTIVLMALRKEPDRRYNSVEQLADDIRRHLDGLPVRARRDTLGYRTRKFIARHRWAVSAALAVVLTVASLVLFYTGRLDARRQDAERSAEQARQEAAKSEQIANWMRDIFRNAHPDMAQGKDVTAREILDQAALRLESRQDFPYDVRWDLQDEIGHAYLGLGKFEEARRLFQQSFEKRHEHFGEEHADVARSRQNLGDAAAIAGDPRTAESQFRQALGLHLQANDPKPLDVATCRQGLASALTDLLDTEHTDPEADAEVETLFQQALQSRRRHLGEDHPLVAETLSSLGGFLDFLNRREESEKMYREALKIRRAHGSQAPTKLSLSCNNLAVLLFDAGKIEEADRLNQEAIEIDRKMLPDSHYKHAYNLNLRATILFKRGSVREAIEVNERALERMIQARGPDHSLVTDIAEQIAIFRLRLESGERR